MNIQTNEQAIQQIVAGAIRNLINGFLIEHKSRDISKQTIKYYRNELHYFCSILDEVSVINLDEYNSSLIRQYLHNLRKHLH